VVRLFLRPPELADLIVNDTQGSATHATVPAVSLNDEYAIVVPDDVLRTSVEHDALLGVYRPEPAVKDNG